MRINNWVEEPLDVLGLDTQDGIVLGDEFFIGHVHGHFERRHGSALAHAGLEHVQVAVFNRELHVLHVAIVLLQNPAHALQLRVNLRHSPGHFVEMHRRADSRHHVFPLGVEQEVAVKFLLAGAGVASKTDAGPGIVSGVAEDHLDNIDRRPEQACDFLHPAVRHRLFRHPGVEDCANGAPQLFLRVFRKVLAGLRAEVLFILRH